MKMFRPRGLNSLLQAGTLFTTIPIVDIQPLINPTSTLAEKIIAGNALDQACRDVGFFYVINHGIPVTTTEGTLSTARSFFQSATPDQKQQLKLSPQTHYRGYQSLGQNVTRYTDSDGTPNFQRDWHEALDYYREVVDDNQLPSSATGVNGDGLTPLFRSQVSPSPIHGTNPWPSDFPRFHNHLQHYIQGCLSLGSTIMKGIALGLGLQDVDTFSHLAADNYWVVRVIHYPELYNINSNTSNPSSSLSEIERSRQLSCGEHTDYGFLTIVNQEQGVSALQVKNASTGEWIAADPIPGALVCNIGDMMRVLTHGEYKPTLHRVINVGYGNGGNSRSRVSVPFFYECGFDTIIEPLKELRKDGNEGEYESVRYGKHLEDKVLSNFELEEASSGSGSGGGG
jgi:isopenicillin N synthase-like dioxygenase